MNNIGYLAKGYNIYKGNPLSEMHDPGFTYPIFKFAYNGVKTADERYEIPEGITIDKLNSCDYSVKIDEITTERNYHNKLEVYASQEVSAEFPGIGASLSFNEQYQTIKDEKVKQHYIHIVSSAECSVYIGKIDNWNLPALDDKFKGTLLKSLPEDYQKNKKLYFDFLDHYGTHFVKEATMGSRMAKITSMTENDKKELVSKNIDIKASASASFLNLFSAKISGGFKSENSKSAEFDKKVQTHKESYIGSKPKGDFLEWANQITEDPMPIQYTLTPIYSLGSDLKRNWEFSQEEGVKLERVFANLKTATSDYCEGRLRDRYPDQKCVAPKTEEKLPTYSGQCALCAKSCGGDYSIESGILAAGKDSSQNFNVLAQGCFGKVSKRDLDQEGVKLCCMPQSKEKPTESCRLCESCGGSFSSSRGKVAKGLKTDNWVQAYDKECSGNLRSRVHSKPGFELCCANSSPCALCTSCGEDYYETGVFGIGDNKKNYQTLGAKCEAPLKEGQDNPNGLRLCCAKNGKAVSTSRPFLPNKKK